LRTNCSECGTSHYVRMPAAPVIGNTAEVLAELRNVLVHLLSGTKFASKAAALRHFMVHPLQALALMNAPKKE
jgi:hypothetical protein